MPTATSQIMDPIKSSLEEGKYTIMLAGSRRNRHSKRERCKRHYTVQNNITAEYGRQDFLLCSCQETEFDFQNIILHFTAKLEQNVSNNFHLILIRDVYTQ